MIMRRGLEKASAHVVEELKSEKDIKLSDAANVATISAADPVWVCLLPTQFIKLVVKMELLLLRKVRA